MTHDAPLSIVRLRTLARQARAEAAKECRPLRILFWTVRRRHKWTYWANIWNQGVSGSSTQFGAAFYVHQCPRCQRIEMKRIDAP